MPTKACAESGAVWVMKFDCDEPVTVSVLRTVVPGREQDYEAWIRDISAVAARFPGHQGVNVLRPSPATDNKYVVIYRFASYADSRRWEESSDRKTWIAKLDGLVEGEADYKHVTGLEFWFDLPELPVAATPSPHKMALTLIVVVFCLVYALQMATGPLVEEWPLWARVMLSVLVQVILMTYLIMPRVTRLLKGWLYH